jgi:hypothetical protein
MTTITQKQYDSLVKHIYDSFMSLPDIGMGEMGEAKEAAERIVDEWMGKNDITISKNK